MSTTKPPKQLGAQRFYNAVKAGNVGFVAMYVTSLRSGIVQGIDGVKVFEAWSPTGNIEMLNVLLSVPELRSFKTYRRHSMLPFGTAVLRKVNALTFDEAHAAEIRAYVQAFESTQRVPEYDELAGKLAAQIGSDATWPYATMAESRRLSELMLGLQSFTDVKSNEVMDWYLDMFGVPKDLPKGELRQSIINLFQNKQWLQLEKLLPDVALRRQVFADNWNIGNPIKTAANGHQYYLELLRIAPWIKT